MKVKNPSLAAIAALALVGPANAAVIAGGNGSFETVTIGTEIYPNAWRVDQVTITGWTYTERGIVDEVNGATWFMGGSDYGTASDGNYQLNLISAGTSYFLSTAITGLTVGASYTVNFDARLRDNSGGGNFDVVVNTTVPTGGFDITPTSTTWAQQSITFTAEATSHTLSIANYNYADEAATATGTGLMVDNFSVIPEPSAALLGSLGMLALLRRRRA